MDGFRVEMFAILGKIIPGDKGCAGMVRICRPMADGVNRTVTGLGYAIEG